MKYIASLVFGLSTAATVPALATDAPVQHYEAQEMASASQALASLETNSAKVDDILKADALDVQKMEAIHEISYSLESAVETLMKSGDKAHKNIIFSLDETVANLHMASEDHEADNTKKWGEKLHASVAALETATK